MATTDAASVREALIDLTTQYQSQQIDAARFQEEINALKSNYSPLTSAIAGFDECYDYYTELNPCLEVVQLGKAHTAASPPLTDKEIFFRGMSPHIKSPEEKKAFRELIQFSDEHKIPYTEYFKLLENAFKKFGFGESRGFEADMKLGLDPQKFLLQSILYAAMYALSKAPPLTADQLSRAPEGLRLYYNGFEQTVLGHLMRWEIMPVPGDPTVPPILAAAYFPQNNSLLTSSDITFPSLSSSHGLSLIYHELFHAYQDSRKTSQGASFAELHAHFVGCLSVLRMEQRKEKTQRKSFENLKEEDKQRREQVQFDPGFSKDDLFGFNVGFNKEEMIKTAQFFWDWARVTLDKNYDDPQLASKKEFILKERIQYAAVIPFLNAFASSDSKMNQYIQTATSSTAPDIFVQKLDGELQKVERALGATYTKLGIDPLLENRDAEVFRIIESLSKEFLKDDLQYAERKKKYEEQYQALQSYFYQVAAKAIILNAKAYLLKSVNSPQAEEVMKEWGHFKNNVFYPVVNNYMGIFFSIPCDGIE